MIVAPAETSHSHALSPPVRAILDDLDLSVTECVRVARERDELVEHYRIEAAQGSYFLKVLRPENGLLKAAFHGVFGRPSMRRQIAVHAALQRLERRHLRIPRLVDADETRFVLMEYVPVAINGGHGIDAEVLVASLLEFQRAGAPVQSRDPGLVLLDVVLHPEIHTARMVLTGIRHRLGTRTAWNCIELLWRCRRHQPRLDHAVLVHNDFHPENVLMGSQGETYVSDFENVTASRRWLLLDIVHYAVSTNESRIDVELIQRHIAALKSDPELSDGIRFEVQMRMALLRRIVQHISTTAPPEHVRDSYARFLMATLLPDRAFEDWYADRFS